MFLCSGFKAVGHDKEANLNVLLNRSLAGHLQAFENMVFVVKRDAISMYFCPSIFVFDYFLVNY